MVVDWMNVAQNSVQWRMIWRWLCNLVHEVQKTDANEQAVCSCITEFRWKLLGTIRSKHIINLLAPELFFKF